MSGISLAWEQRMWRGLLLFAFLLPISIVLVQPVAYALSIAAMVVGWKTPKANRPA